MHCRSSGSPRSSLARKVPTAIWGLMAILLTPGTRAADSCPGGRDLVLIHGKVLTVDFRGPHCHNCTHPRSPLPEGWRAAQARRNVYSDRRSRGRTVIPGLIDNHTHFVRTAQAPGPFIEGLEAADSIQALQTALAVAAKKAEAL